MRLRVPHKLDQNGITHNLTPWVIVLIVGFSVLMTFHSVTSHAAGVSSDVKSGIKGYCLDDHDDSASAGAAVDSWRCNDSEAQTWTVGISSIKHGDSLCLAVDRNGTSTGDKVVLNACNTDPGQVWLIDQGGFYNPNSNMCLALPNDQTTQQLVIASCSYVSEGYEQWQSASPPSCKDTTGGERIACFAVQEWSSWQTGNPSHETLLNTYTDGAPYEEWCADFVSYVFKEAGSPFTGGETNGWDENIANNVQYQGFTLHPAILYIAQPGDVAFFDYAGGHVEIVVSGGPTPTYVYGNSATIDPTTGNGQMEANTISDEGTLGQVSYFLTRNN